MALSGSRIHSTMQRVRPSCRTRSYEGSDQHPSLAAPRRDAEWRSGCIEPTGGVPGPSLESLATLGPLAIAKTCGTCAKFEPPPGASKHHLADPCLLCGY